MKSSFKFQQALVIGRWTLNLKLYPEDWQDSLHPYPQSKATPDLIKIQWKILFCLSVHFDKSELNQNMGQMFMPLTLIVMSEN